MTVTVYLWVVKLDRSAGAAMNKPRDKHWSLPSWLQCLTCHTSVRTLTAALHNQQGHSHRQCHTLDGLCADDVLSQIPTGVDSNLYKPSIVHETMVETSFVRLIHEVFLFGAVGFFHLSSRWYFSKVFTRIFWQDAVFFFPWWIVVARLYFCNMSLK